MTMASNRPPTAADNFKLINGVGPAIERRLHKANILTFAQLAIMSPTEIAELVEGLAGRSAEQIAQQDWVGQARRLASKPAPADSHPMATSHGNRQHYATFTVELLLDEANNVRRTQVKHIQSRDKAPETWAGWDANRMLQFVIQQAALQLEEVAPVGSIPGAAPTRLGGMINLRGLETMPTETNTPHQVLAYGQPFDVHLTLDLTEATAPRDNPLEYSAAVFAKSLKGDQRQPQTVSEARGTIMLQDLLTITMKGIPLPRGLYRLEAVATLALPSAQSQLTAQLEGCLLQIY